VKKASGETARRLDRLAEVLRGATDAQLEEVLTKSESLTVRLTAAEKEEMKAAASWYGLTLTEYLSRLHAFAEALRAKRAKR
jgi:hypothetical protein